MKSAVTASLILVVAIVVGCARASEPTPTVTRAPSPAIEPLTPIDAATVAPSPTSSFEPSRQPTATELAPSATTIVASSTTAPTNTAAPNKTSAPTETVALAKTAAPVATAALAPTMSPIPAVPTVVQPSPTSVPKAASTIPASSDVPGHFSDVSRRTTADALAYLKGQLAAYPGSTSASVLNFSPSNILETMDTIVLDRVESSEGEAALQRVYDTIAADVLTTLRETDGNGWILVALDAGHGGNRAFYFDPGSAGTEWRHTRAVVAAMQRLVASGDYPRIVLRPIFDDAVTDDFRIPKGLDRPTIDSILMRQARASMLAREAADWNAAHPDRPVAVHEISIHFNAGSGGAMVLYQGDTVRAEYVSTSLAFGQQYLHRVIADLNRTGLLPAPLHPWSGSGLHDDVMMYRPAYVNGLDLPAGFVLRYGVLQGRGYLPRYMAKALGIS